MNKIDYLVISSTIDFSTDLVCYQLLLANKKFYRLNRDEFIDHEIEINLQKKYMKLSIQDRDYFAYFDTLKGIYFRAPVFLRTQSKKELTVEEQLERNQWSSFLRNLIVFNNALWINNPVDVFRAENKIYQLQIAQKNGLAIPQTVITNTTNFDISDNELYVIKSLDTALLYDFKNNKEMFTYSNIIKGQDLRDCELKQAPVFIQEYLSSKIDCRITYINKKLFPVQILLNGKGMFGDWRFHKSELSYVPFVLPQKVEKAIINMMNELHLSFGGIDLIYSKGEYYFIEVNPTGEWGWIEMNTQIPISREIQKALCGDSSND